MAPDALASLSPAELSDLLRYLSPVERAEFERLIAAPPDSERRPLAVADLWHHDPPRTSQRRALQQCAGSVAMALLGGNGSGKSDAVVQLGVAAMLGREHPHTREWLDRNRLPAETVPPYPGRVLLSALTSNDSRRVLRSKVKRYLPKGADVRWRNEEGDGEAEVRIKGAPNGSAIVFKSNDQGRRGYQGDEFDISVLDEEHDLDVFEEVLLRGGRRPWRGSYIVLSLTPLKGFTWVYHKFLGKPEPGYRHAHIHGLDNPHADPEYRKRVFAGLSAEQIEARERGGFVVLEGRVYKEFQRSVHVVPSFVPPREWPRYRGIDFGVRNPFCCLWVAEDPRDTVFHVYREFYRPSPTEEAGHAVNKLSEGDVEPEWTAADPESLDGRITLRDKCDIVTLPAVKDVEEGISDVRELLKLDGDGKPHLVFHDCCINAIREHESYAYPPATGARGPQEAPIKRDDHACDTLRYIIRLRKIRGG